MKPTIYPSILYTPDYNDPSNYDPYKIIIPDISVIATADDMVDLAYTVYDVLVSNIFDEDLDFEYKLDPSGMMVGVKLPLPSDSLDEYISDNKLEGNYLIVPWAIDAFRLLHIVNDMDDAYSAWVSDTTGAIDDDGSIW